MAFRMYFVAAGLLAALPAGADDLTIVSKMTRDGGEPTTATSYLSSDHARMVQPDGQEAILDLKTGQTTVIDGRKKEYFVVTRQDMDQMKAKLEQTMNSPEMKRAQEQMKNLPPEVQKKMQGMMGGGPGGFDVKKTGTKVAFNPGTHQLKQGLEKLKPLLEVTSILFVNKEEARRLVGELPTIKELLTALCKVGPDVTVITDGGRRSAVAAVSPHES